ncbi:ABC transporter substrate-binding protein [Aeromicrobium sp. Sec7.5]|uniref:ABC transporter substrate-binding protein n=1 Tax=Aeromicrobium sp. Sec7.5 TaxID=3121276 RepID=UPI002FE4956B
MFPSRRRLAAFAVPLLLVPAACGGGSEDDADLQQVDYLTSFNTFGRDAYVYVAIEKGYFEDEGLEVDVKPGTGSVDVMKLVASGQADFGAADFSTVAATVANEDIPVKAVGMVHQQSLAAIVTLADTGIEDPAELEGASIADQAGSTNQVLFPAYAEAAGFDGSSVTFVPSAPPSLPQLLASGQVDAIGQFVVGKGLIEAAAQGREAKFFPYSEFLPDLYGNAVVASDTLIADDPELVEKFTRALLRGLEYSIENPEETGDILAQYQPTQDPAVAAGEVELMADYVTGDDDALLGSIDEERVASIIEELTQGGAVTKPVEAGDLVALDLTPKD